MFDSEGVRDLLLPKPRPKHVLLETSFGQDESTSALLHQFDQTVYAGGHAFVDTADVFRRLVRAEKGVPPKLCIYTPFLDQLHSHYIVLLDAALRANEACARYLFSCRRALDPLVMHSNLRTQVELDTLQAFTEFWVRCMEVRTSVDDTFAQWEEAAEQLRTRTAQIPPAVEWLFCFTGLAYSVFKRREYTKLATTLAKIEAARTTGVPEA
ncbi:hypothetical protein B0H11DRAFT_2233094 [Mycena galericulata]|nr:hypothetical protein B0H11DRAFT_2233094 [Mycena galericulata]